MLVPFVEGDRFFSLPIELGLALYLSKVEGIVIATAIAMKEYTSSLATRAGIPSLPLIRNAARAGRYGMHADNRVFITPKPGFDGKLMHVVIFPTAGAA